MIILTKYDGEWVNIEYLINIKYVDYVRNLSKKVFRKAGIHLSLEDLNKFRDILKKELEFDEVEFALSSEDLKRSNLLYKEHCEKCMLLVYNVEYLKYKDYETILWAWDMDECANAFEDIGTDIRNIFFWDGKPTRLRSVPQKEYNKLKEIIKYGLEDVMSTEKVIEEI